MGPAPRLPCSLCILHGACVASTLGYMLSEGFPLPSYSSLTNARSTTASVIPLGWLRACPAQSRLSARERPTGVAVLSIPFLTVEASLY